MDISWPELVEIYRHTTFDAQKNEGRLKIATQGIVDTLRKIEADGDLYDEAQISLVRESDKIGVGLTVNIAWNAPSQALGLLVRDFDDLFKSINAGTTEAPRYFVINAAFASSDTPVPEKVLEYRAMLRISAHLRNAAAYVDEVRHELIFIGSEKIAIPMRFSASDLQPVITQAAPRLDGLLSDTLHADHKATILVAAVCELAAPVRENDRFGYLLRNLEGLCDRIERGYKLFVSSFSYSKIRNDVETARVDFIGKIHKTIVDIQNQLLGIPVATMVVAAQLKDSDGCDPAFWTNVAVLVGALIFVGLLILAVVNQQKTLIVLRAEIHGQESRLSKEYADVASQFSDVFTDLKSRLNWHRNALRAVICIGLLGFAVALAAFLALTKEGSAACLMLWR